MSSSKRIFQLLLPFTVIISIMVIFLLSKPSNRNINQALTEEDAAGIVSNLPEISALLVKYPHYLIETEVLDQNTNAWKVHVYEIVEDHTATYNWYNVDVDTGKVDQEF